MTQYDLFGILYITYTDKKYSERRPTNRSICGRQDFNLKVLIFTHLPNALKPEKYYNGETEYQYIYMQLLENLNYPQRKLKVKLKYPKYRSKHFTFQYRELTSLHPNRFGTFQLLQTGD